MQPPPRSHLLRYHGVLAPHAKERKRVVPPEPPTRKDPCDSRRKPGDPRGGLVRAAGGGPRGRNSCVGRSGSTSSSVRGAAAGWTCSPASRRPPRSGRSCGRSTCPTSRRARLPRARRRSGALISIRIGTRPGRRLRPSGQSLSHPASKSDKPSYVASAAPSPAARGAPADLGARGRPPPGMRLDFLSARFMDGDLRLPVFRLRCSA